MHKKHNPKKRFGQNFLVDSFTVDNILSVLAPSKEDHFVEIGPGLGALAIPLSNNNIKKLDLIEIDRDLITKIKPLFFAKKNVDLYEADALQFPFDDLRQDQSLRLIGNLPYNISTPFIFYCLNFLNIIQDMHFMLQLEVVDRITATPNNRSYGRLSIMIQYSCDVEKLFVVKSSSFNPQPKVDSAMIKITPKFSKHKTAINLEFFSKLVNVAFQKRRKTIQNALSNYITKNDLENIGIDSQNRPENLTVDNFVDISNYLWKSFNEKDAF